MDFELAFNKYTYWNYEYAATLACVSDSAKIYLGETFYSFCYDSFKYSFSYDSFKAGCSNVLAMERLKTVQII